MDNLLSVRQVAYILKVHPLSVRRYIKQSKLKAVRVAGNIRVKESDLQQFQQTVETAPPLQSTAEEIIVRAKRQIARPFTDDDPFLRLRGRGASLSLD